MTERQEDPDREHRIAMEIIVDAYSREEQALGWYYYLEDKLSFPFHARCTRERASSPLAPGDEVEVVGMPPESECDREILVTVRTGRRPLAVPLSQLAFVRADAGATRTGEAMEDWHYWVERGYRF